MNYAAHNKELHHSLDLLEPVIFMKADSVLKDGKPFFIPDFSDEVHYETEIVIKICWLGKNIDERFASRNIQVSYIRFRLERYRSGRSTRIERMGQN